MTDYPLFPELSDKGKEEAEQLILRFKDRIKSLLNEILDDLYVEIVPHIESDSWTNFRNHLMDGFKDYTNNRLVQGEYDFKQIRQKIFCEHREAIINDLNQDNLKKIADLEKDVKEWRDRYHEVLDSRGRY